MHDTLQGTAVLVIDDDADTLDVFARSLRGYGAIVNSASDVASAVAILETFQPHVVLCDLHMPDRDGYDFLAAMRARPEWDAIPVIAISGSHPSVEHERSLAAGFVEHLVKPTKLREIIDAVTRVIAATR